MDYKITKQSASRAAIYLRVSTDEQAKEGHYGLDYQDAKAKSFVALQEYSLDQESHIFRDEGYSGALPAEDRPRLKALFEAARRREFDVLVVYKIDRLSRNLRNLLNMIHELESYGVAIRSVSEPFDTASPYGKNTLQIMGSFAELEKELIKERMTAGRIMAAKAGKWVMGTPPYGYRVNRKSQRLVIDPQEAKWVRKFFEWLVYEGCSLREIARRANSLKVPTKNERMKTKRKCAKAWWVRTIGRMVTHETYTGTAYFRRYTVKHRDIRSWIDPSRSNPKHEWVAIPVPQIVTLELFQSAIKQLRRNRDLAARNAKRVYLFAKLLHCAKCGFRLKGNFYTPKTQGGVGSRHYVGVLPPKSLYASKRCRYCGSIAESRLMPIWQALKVTLSEPGYVQDKLGAFLNQSTGRLDVEERRAELEAQVEHVASQRRRINFAYLESQAIDEKEFKARLRENDLRREGIIEERARLDRLFVSKEEKERQASSLSDLYDRLKHNLENPSYETMSQVVHLLVNRIDLDIDQNLAQVEFNFPGIHPVPEELATPATFAGQSPQRASHKDLALPEPLPPLSPQKGFTLTCKVPLITTEEWRAASAAGLRRTGHRYHEREAAAMAELAAQKARSLYI